MRRYATVVFSISYRRIYNGVQKLRFNGHMRASCSSTRLITLPLMTMQYVIIETMGRAVTINIYQIRRDVRFHGIPG